MSFNLLNFSITSNKESKTFQTPNFCCFMYRGFSKAILETQFIYNSHLQEEE